MLDLIPREIIPDDRDRNSLSRVSKKLHALVTPMLYESITVRSKDESNLQQTNIDKFLANFNRQRFTYVKDIRFLAPIDQKDQFRCIHNDLLDQADQDDIESRDEGLASKLNDLGNLMAQVRPLFQSLQDNQLRSFHWHLGTCIPKDIIAPGGYLPTKQPSIEELSLITSDPCDVAKEDWEYEMDLTQFTSLNEFSWCGGMSRREFGVLRNMLHTHSSSLKFLKLDLVDWWDAQYNWCDNDYDWEAWIKDHNFITEKVLGVCPEETHLVLSALKSLSLSSVGLRAIVDSGTPINLSTLELVISHASDGEYNKQADEEWFVPFLNSFRGLRDLYLEVENGRGVAAMQRYWPSIFHHHQTLRSIAIEDDKVLDLFTEMSLECIGLCLVPAIPKTQIFSNLTLAQVNNLKLLCLRDTHPLADSENPFESEEDQNNAIREFAKWAFKMFPRLLFIAFGNLPNGHPTVNTREIFRRQPFPGVESNDFPDSSKSENQVSEGFDGFQELEMEDSRFADYLERLREVLEACPTDPLYRKNF
ncbi:hypothetical protein L207DRAFT_527057 [Hyaloscypha variabilis F]|uniref:Uncharacterized protein n=1 Tax=Hyaloscypha variabilis (strain UAMH 11265 / GT02V1 / F) TaxID=1149755 RepID=A0A2J6RUG2_HYAVF|nr:hypothetical protein L207DRAFT_527057 [Hyaloscypha variabilis F]